MMKKLTALLTALFLLLSATALADEVLHIGIIQFAEHGSLDNCRIGFIEGLAEEGFVEGENVVFDVQNAQADTAISAQIADVMAGKYDMICAIATPAAMAAFNAAEDAGIPVIYTAVSDPVSAMLAGADGKNPGNITGTSDALPVEAQLKLIRALMPDATKIGILHTTSETNSDATLALYKELAPNYGFEIIDKGISTGADLPMALDALLPQVDCTTNLTDNTVVSYLAVVLEKSEEYGSPCSAAKSSRSSTAALRPKVSSIPNLVVRPAAWRRASCAAKAPRISPTRPSAIPTCTSTPMRWRHTA